MKRRLLYKGYCVLGCLLLVLSVVLCPCETILANEAEDMNTELEAVDEEIVLNTSDGFEGLNGVSTLSDAGAESIHLVENSGDFKYELDVIISRENSTSATSKERIAYGIGTFKCYYKNTTWLYTATLNATFHYNGTYAWTGYGHYSWKNNTKINFRQDVVQNTFSSKKVTGKTTYTVGTNVYCKYGYMGLHTLKITCTPKGVIDISKSITK